MTLWNFLQNHSLEEILENDELVLLLDNISSSKYPNTIFCVDDGVFTNYQFRRTEVCRKHGCEYYEEFFDEETGINHCDCDLVERKAIENGWDGRYETKKQFIKNVKCPYEKEHIDLVKNNVKQILLKDLES